MKRHLQHCHSLHKSTPSLLLSEQIAVNQFSSRAQQPTIKDRSPMAALNQIQTRWMMVLCVALWWSINCAQTLKATADHVVLATVPKTPSLKTPPANSTAPSPSPSSSPTSSPDSAPSKAPAKPRSKRHSKSSSPSPSPSPSPSAGAPVAAPDSTNGGMKTKSFASGVWATVFMPLAFMAVV